MRDHPAFSYTAGTVAFRSRLVALGFKGSNALPISTGGVHAPGHIVPIESLRQFDDFGPRLVALASDLCDTLRYLSRTGKGSDLGRPGRAGRALAFQAEPSGLGASRFNR
ncbi:hypothetical protein [Methylobacterium oryzisoli]|uniref:hypothetical protein n=1 Tax=Methylobacterium oryzisoli TaxID=3385502 RepID=UPI003891AC67